MGGVLRLLFSCARGTWRVNQGTSRGERVGFCVLRYLLIGFVVFQLVEPETFAPVLQDVGTIVMDGIKAQVEIAKAAEGNPNNSQTGKELEGEK